MLVEILVGVQKRKEKNFKNLKKIICFVVESSPPSLCQ
jgi:hypothetical protein